MNFMAFSCLLLPKKKCLISKNSLCKKFAEGVLFAHIFPKCYFRRLYNIPDNTHLLYRTAFQQLFNFFS